MKARVLVLALLLLSLCDRVVSSNVRGIQHGEATGRRNLVRIFVVGESGSPPPEALPLSVCTGDCDNDAEVSLWVVSLLLYPVYYRGHLTWCLSLVTTVRRGLDLLSTRTFSGCPWV